MAKPWIHAVSSAKKFGGVPEDYFDIHNLMDLLILPGKFHHPQEIHQGRF